MLQNISIELFFYYGLHTNDKQHNCF